MLCCFKPFLVGIECHITLLNFYYIHFNFHLIWILVKAMWHAGTFFYALMSCLQRLFIFFSNLKSLNMLWITWRRYFARHFEIGFDSLVCEDSEDCTLISACCPSLCMHAYGETRSQHVFTSYGPVSSITPNYVIFYSWTWGPDRKALLVVIKKELAEINGIYSWKKSCRLAYTK